jgi:hypothetical protein
MEFDEVTVLAQPAFVVTVVSRTTTASTNSATTATWPAIATTTAGAGHRGLAQTTASLCATSVGQAQTDCSEARNGANRASIDSWRHRDQSGTGDG